MGWIEFKDMLAGVTGLSKDALHIYAALMLQIGVAFILRQSLKSPLPWLCVLVALLLNEWFDLSHLGHVEAWQVEGGIRDIWNTMLLPTLLLVLARWAPTFLIGKVPEAAVDEVGPQSGRVP